jgi:hypothetical protein
MELYEGVVCVRCLHCTILTAKSEQLSSHACYFAVWNACIFQTLNPLTDLLGELFAEEYAVLYRVTTGDIL